MLTNEKYVKQTYEAMSNAGLNLEVIAIQISQLPVREQHKFFRLLINYLDIASNLDKYPYRSTMKDIINLSKSLMEVVNNYYAEEDSKQMALF